MHIVRRPTAGNEGEQCLFVGTRGTGFAGPLSAPP